MELNVSDVAVARGSRPVLEGVNFAVPAGRALVLRGPNGSGKTTLLRAVAGLQPVLSGEITGAGERVAYAGHADGIKASLSVTENLAFWSEIFGTGDVGAAMEAFELGALARRPAGALSAGQKRRLGLARLVVTGRPLWVLDEPTVSLDKDGVALFAAVVARHLAAGGQAVIATHIDLGLGDADVFDVTPYRAKRRVAAQDEAFL